jgi:hypothetical protein
LMFDRRVRQRNVIKDGQSCYKDFPIPIVTGIKLM